jgi:hypothetical protein
MLVGVQGEVDCFKLFPGGRGWFLNFPEEVDRLAFSGDSRIVVLSWSNRDLVTDLVTVLRDHFLTC